jgi:hypothetical protein
MLFDGALCALGNVIYPIPRPLNIHYMLIIGLAVDTLRRRITFSHRTKKNILFLCSKE